MTSSPHHPTNHWTAAHNAARRTSFNVNMASTPVTVDKRRTCNICLEAFEGRQPKMLSCFHTFCSPCLLQLVDRETQKGQVSTSTRRDEGTGEKDLPVTLTCPTCRTCVPLPSGGVSQLQTNFYLEEEAAHDPSPLLCDLCEEGQKAEFQCASCVKYFCSRCRRSHDKLCKSPAASLITDSTGSAGTQSVGKESQDLAQRMEDVLKKVAEEEKKLALERRATEQDIYERYNTVLRHAAEARDSSLMSLRDVTQAVTDSLMNTASLAREVLTKAKDKTSEMNRRASKDEVLTESTLHHFEELLKKADDEALLTCTITENNTHVLTQFLSNFMITVTAAGSKMASEIANGDQRFRSFQLTGTSSQQNADHPDSFNAKLSELMALWQDLSSRFTQNEKAFAELQAQNSSLIGAQVQEDAKVTDDFTVLRKEMTSLRDEVASQRRDLAGMREKHCLMLQENEIISSDLNRVKTVQNKTQSSHAQFQTECDKIHTDLRQLRTDHGQVETAVKHLQSDRDQVLTNLTTMQGDVDQLQVDRNKLKTDQDTLTSEVQTLKTDVGQLNDLCLKDKTAIAGLETRLSKINMHVAFHASLEKTLSVTRTCTIVCDQVRTNIGGGYNGQTGEFTAPVSGTYCFMATSGPDGDYDADLAALLIMMGEQELGYLNAGGRGVSACHCTAHVQAGQRVRLTSYHHRKRYYPETRGARRFAGGWETTFTGMLLRPDL